MEKKRTKLTKNMQGEELKILRGDKDIDESLLEAQLNGKGESRIQSRTFPSERCDRLEEHALAVDVRWR
jgi:hypothetical protein